MKLAKYTRIFGLGLVLSVFIVLAFSLSPTKAKAYSLNSGGDFCPPITSNNQTIYGIGDGNNAWGSFSASVTQGSNYSITLVATTGICSGASYSSVGNARIDIQSKDGGVGIGAVSFGNLTKGVLVQRDVTLTVATSLYPAGQSLKRCFTWYGSADYDNGRINSQASTLCVYLTIAPPPTPKWDASCSISAPSTLNSGQDFDAKFSVSNTGTQNWAVLPGSNYTRLALITSDIWGDNRVELPPSQDLRVIAGSTVFPTHSFQAPSTPGTYTMTWRAVHDPGVLFGSTCSKTITIREQIQIGGRVYNSDTNTGAAGVTVYLCDAGTAVTNSQGYWTKLVNSRTSYCARVTGSVPTGWNGPTTRQDFSSLGHGLPNWSSHTSYEWQYSDAYCHRWADPSSALADGKNKYCPDSDNIADNDIFIQNNGSAERSTDFIYTSIAPTCSVSSDPNPAEPGTIVQLVLKVNGAANISYSASFDNTGIAFSPGVPSTITLGTDGTWTQTMTASSVTGMGLHNLKLTINGSVNCTGVLTVGNQPYLKVYGNDVAVGDKFAGGSCNADGSRATVLTLGNKDRSGRSNTVYDYSGAGAQLAVFALGEIDQFFSAGQQSPSAGLGTSTVPTGLTFGNSNDGSSLVSGYGGRSAISHCAINYFDILTSGKPPTLSTNLISAPGDFTYLKNTGATPLHLSGATISSKKALVVDGDVYIDGNISYGPYSSVDTIPSFYLVVRGNIYIDKSVTNLSGVYVAQPNGDSKGTIYTCASGNSFVAASDLYDQCNKQLTINGAFIAKNVKFLRTHGTKKDSPANEPWNSSTIAEVFKSSPEMYLSAPAALTNVGGSTGSYDSITSLPPIF